MTDLFCFRSLSRLVVFTLCLTEWASLGSAGEIGCPICREPIRKTCDPGGVWIVSARNAAQSPADCPGRLEVLNQAQCGRLQRSSWDGLLSSMDPTAPTLVFVHGSFLSTEYVRRDVALTDNWLHRGLCGRRCNRIYFTWPSEGPSAFLACAVNRLEQQARFNGHHLVRLLSRLPASSQVTLLGHSHGCEIISSALHLIAGGCVDGRRACCQVPRCPRSVMAAAAMDGRDFNPGHEFDRALKATPSMLVLISRRDAALRLYPTRRLFAGLALGTAGLRTKNRAKIGPDSGRVRHTDVTSLIGVHHVWQYYRSEPSIARVVADWTTRP